MLPLLVLRLPWVVEIVFTCLDQEDLEVVIEVGKSASGNTAGAASTADDNINLVRDSHCDCDF